MIHQVLCDEPVLSERNRNFELCSNAVDAGDQNRFFQFAEICPEQSAKTAHASEHFRAVRGAHLVLKPFFDPIAESDIDPCGCVRLLPPVFHFNPANNSGCATSSLKRRERAFRRSIMNLSSSGSIGTGYCPLKQARQKSFFGKPVARTMPSRSR